MGMVDGLWDGFFSNTNNRGDLQSLDMRKLFVRDGLELEVDHHV
jgi:hypothetical protein